IWFDGVDLASLPRPSLRRYRPRIQLVLQDGANALNPNFSVAEIVEEPLLIRGGTLREERHVRALEVIREVGLPPEVADRTALELSGGQRQRVAIARAIIVGPDLMILDECMSGLDRESQVQLIQLLSKLQAAHSLSYIFITHDAALVRMIADQVAVLHEGQIKHFGPLNEVLDPDTCASTSTPEIGTPR